jgi:hypothetical protein
MPKEYALFNVRLRGAGPEYNVDVQSILGGDASGSFTSPTHNPRYQEIIANLQKLDTDEDMLIELGSLLFQALFHGAVKEAYARSQGGLAPQQGLRVRLDLDPAQTEIAGLPWEFLYDPDQGPLALLDAPIVRYLPQPSAIPKLATSLPLKLLLTGAFTPPAPEVERELTEVREALAPLEQSGYVTIQVEEHLTQSILQRRLREGFQIWHFIGHGGWSRDGRSGTLLFEDGTGSSKAVSAAELNILLNRSGLRLVVLDACNSAEIKTEPYRSVAPALVKAQVPAVIAMQFTVPQEATRPFAGEFYRALGEGLPIDACVTEGRKAVMNTTGLRNPDWGIPVVYTRAPDGTLFEVPAPAAAPAGGININIGDKNQLQSGSSINVSNVGSTYNSGNQGGNRMPDQQPQEQVNRPVLRQLLTTSLNDGDLRDLCFDLNIDYESLPGQGKGDKARELVAYVERHGRAAELIDLCRKIRPNADWQSALSAPKPRIDSQTPSRQGNTNPAGGAPTNVSNDDADEELKNSLRTLISQKKRRLYALQLIAARTGINTQPEVSTEIEDLEGRKDFRGNITSPGEIAKLEQQLKDLGG